MCKYCDSKDYDENERIPSTSDKYEWDDEATEIKVNPLKDFDGNITDYEINIDTPDGDVWFKPSFCPMCGRKLLDRKDN